MLRLCLALALALAAPTHALRMYGGRFGGLDPRLQGTYQQWGSERYRNFSRMRFVNGFKAEIKETQVKERFKKFRKEV